MAATTVAYAAVAVHDIECRSDATIVLGVPALGVAAAAPGGVRNDDAGAGAGTGAGAGARAGASNPSTQPVSCLTQPGWRVAAACVTSAVSDLETLWEAYRQLEASPRACVECLHC